jgi:endonuclease/exonuclease/phosphatase family metal-dependent hydrolase
MTHPSFKSVRVGTFNIKVGVDSSLSQIGADLSRLNWDLCALQEVGQHWSLGTSLDQSCYLGSVQGHSYTSFMPLLERPWTLDPYRGGPFQFSPYQYQSPPPPTRASGYYGIGLTAHGRVTSVQKLYLPNMDDEQRGAIIITWSPSLSLPPLTVITTHLSVKVDERLKQVHKLIEVISNISGPLLLIGDLNDTPLSQSLTLFTQLEGMSRLASDAYLDTFTFSVTHPHRRIDYLLGRGVTMLNYGVATNVKSSDHFPLWADLTW